jgi:hypothetical protein
MSLTGLSFLAGTVVDVNSVSTVIFTGADILLMPLSKTFMVKE